MGKYEQLAETSLAMATACNEAFLSMNATNSSETCMKYPYDARFSVGRSERSTDCWVCSELYYYRQSWWLQIQSDLNGREVEVANNEASYGSLPVLIAMFLAHRVGDPTQWA